MTRMITLVVIFMWYSLSFSQNLLDSVLCNITKHQEQMYQSWGEYYKIKHYKNISKAFRYNSDNDTLYLIESLADDGHFNLSLWSSNDSLTYEYPYGITKGIREDKNLMELIKKWDTEKITHNRKKRPRYYQGGTESITTRIIFRNDSVTFDMIKYWDIGDF